MLNYLLCEQDCSKMAELDPGLWSKLPQEILLSIIDKSNKATLVGWSETCQTYHTYAQVRVWERLLVEYGPRKDRTSLNLDLEKAPPAGSPVKHITIDFRDPAEFPTLTKYKRSRALSEISLINCRWPTITSLDFRGPLNGLPWQDIIAFQNLRELKIRMGEVSRPASPYDSMCTIRTTDRSTMDSRILPSTPPFLRGFERLPNLEWLQSLCVGKLTQGESTALARGIETLKLKSLEVSALDYSNPWQQELPPAPDTIDPYETDSPVLSLLWFICNPDPSRATLESLPVTLIRLVLSDRNRYKLDKEMLEEYPTLLTKSIQDCTELQTLEIDIPDLKHGIAIGRDILLSIVQSRTQAAGSNSIDNTTVTAPHISILEAMEGLYVD